MTMDPPSLTSRLLAGILEVGACRPGADTRENL